MVQAALLLAEIAQRFRVRLTPNNDGDCQLRYQRF